MSFNTKSFDSNHENAANNENWRGDWTKTELSIYDMLCERRETVSLLDKVTEKPNYVKLMSMEEERAVSPAPSIDSINIEFASISENQGRSSQTSSIKTADFFAVPASTPIRFQEAHLESIDNDVNLFTSILTSFETSHLVSVDKSFISDPESDQNTIQQEIKNSFLKSISSNFDNFEENSKDASQVISPSSLTMPPLIRIASSDESFQLESDDEKTETEIDEEYESSQFDYQRLNSISDCISDDHMEDDWTSIVDHSEAQAKSGDDHTEEDQVKSNNYHMKDDWTSFVETLANQIESENEFEAELIQRQDEKSNIDQASTAPKNFNKSLESLSKLSTISSCSDDYVDEKFSKDSSMTSISEATQLKMNPNEYIELLAIDDDIFLAAFPEVIRDPSIVLPFQELPKDSVNDSPLNIHISEIFSPIHFWFQYEHDVVSLMEKLQEDYQRLKEKQLLISDSNIKPGLLVACYLPEFKKWHRALVINPVDETNRVRMNMFDYGTIGMVNKKHIKFLFKSYLQYPRYALRGRFVNLKPFGERIWSENKVEKFLNLIGNRELKGFVKRFDERESIYELDITLKTGDNEFNVQDWLIKHQIAVEFVMQPTSIYPSCYYFPSFDMLEKNYPTFHEISYMLDDGIDYEILVQTNFLRSINPKMLKTSPKLFATLGHKQFQDIKKLYFH